MDSRRLVQLGFVALTLVGVFVVGGNAERWCPFGGVEALYPYASEGNLICSLGVSNLYILLAVLAMTLLLRRAFCGYVCPIGTIGEWLRLLGRQWGIRGPDVPRRLERSLAPLKYGVLAIVLYFTWRTGELMFRGYDPCYALLSRHGTDITIWAYVLSGILAAASLWISVPFCRWLCPLAAVLTPFARLGLTRVRRVSGECIDCGACRRVCPMGIRVDQVEEVTTGHCTACLECLAACPRPGGRAALTWSLPRWLGGGRWPRPALIGAALVCLGAAVGATFALPLPSFAQSWGAPATRTETVALRVRELTCRGRATLLVYFLQRDDELELPGYMKVEAWPGPDAAAVRVVFDPTVTSADSVRRAIVTPYFDAVGGAWRVPPFRIEGYDPWGLDE